MHVDDIDAHRETVGAAARTAKGPCRRYPQRRSVACPGIAGCNHWDGDQRPLVRAKPHRPPQPQRDEADLLAVPRDRVELAQDHLLEAREGWRGSLENAHRANVHRCVGPHDVQLVRSLMPSSAHRCAASTANRTIAD